MCTKEELVTLQQRVRDIYVRMYDLPPCAFKGRLEANLDDLNATLYEWEESLLTN